MPRLTKSAGKKNDRLVEARATAVNRSKNPVHHLFGYYYYFIY